MGRFEKPRTNTEEAELERSFREITGSGKQSRKSASGKKKTGAGRGPNKTAIIICIAVALVVLLAGGCSAWYYFGYTGDDGCILSNVYAAGVDLSGMTVEQATSVLKMSTDSTYAQQDLVIHLPDEDIRLSPADTGVQLDVDAVVADAYNYGRGGTAAEQRQARKDAALTSYTIDLIPYLGLDDSYIRSVMEDLGQRYNTVLTQPTVTVTGERPALEADALDEEAEGQVLIVTMGIPESALDTTALYGMILDSYSENKFEITMDFSILQPEEPDLEAIYAQYCVEPVDAVLDENTYEVVPEVYGYGFDLTAARNLVEQAQPGETVEIPLDYISPDVRAETIQATLFCDLLGSCEAYQSSSANRITNLDLACAAINGVVLKPGETFSYNETLGERTEEKGYKGAGAYVGGQSVTSIGGGICQVSSALYYSVLHADLEVVERYNHMYATGYVDLGMDATVSWGSLDFKFRNNTNYPIRIEAESDNGLVTVKLYGTDEKDYYVEMTYEVVNTYNPSVVYKEMSADNTDGYRDGDVIQTSYTGYDVKTYKNKYSKSTGELISSELEDFSDYNKRDKIVCKIKVAEPETTAPAEQSEDGAVG